MKENSTYMYQALKNNPGIWKHKTSGQFLARKKIRGKSYRKTFRTIRQAIEWRNNFGEQEALTKKAVCSKLKDVWTEMQRQHFPILADSTQEIWIRRYALLKDLEDLPMDRITSSVLSSWVERHVGYFKSDFYENDCRGRAKRCDLINELNLLVTIFNWYKRSETFEIECKGISIPVGTHHKKMSFIRSKPVKNLAITIEHALKFFAHVKPLYVELSTLQYYTASRIGEVAGLHWSRVDFENKRLVIMETLCWDQQTKVFKKINPHPKNKVPRPIYMTPEIEAILRARLPFKQNDCPLVFHVEGKPLNYGTIQLNYREAQRKSGVPYTGTHIFRHGMAKLARRVGGGLDAVIAMTGHKDFKLADHYSKLDEEFHQEVSEKVMSAIRLKMDQLPGESESDNVVSINQFRRKSIHANI